MPLILNNDEYDELEARGFIERMRCATEFNPTNAQLIAHAVKLGDLPVATWLIEHGAGVQGVDPTHEDPDKAKTYDRRRALEWACLEGHVELCRWLLASGGMTSCDVRKMRAAMGKKPFHLACAGGHVDVLEWLVSEGDSADLIDEKDGAGNTPLHWACCFHHTAAAAWLISRLDKSQLCHTNKLGFTPMSFACNAGAGYPICQRLVCAGGAAVMAHDIVKSQMTTGLRRELAAWVRAQVQEHTWFLRGALFGMSQRSGSPHLSKLNGKRELVQLVADFVGVETDTAVLAMLRQTADELPPPPQRHSIAATLHQHGPFDDELQCAVPQCSLPSLAPACIVS